MKIELVHDSLAKSIFDAASADDKARLKAEGLVKTRYAYYKSDSRFYLGEGELSFIRPFLKDMELGELELAFVAASEQKIKKDHARLRQRNYIIIGMAAFIICLPFVFSGWYNAYSESKRAEHAQMEKNMAQDSLKNARSEVNNLRKVVIGETPTEDINTELSELKPEEVKVVPVFKAVRVWGVVHDAKKRPLQHAEIEFMGAKVKSVMNGRFDLYLILPPYYAQQKELQLQIRARGFEEQTAVFDPQAEPKMVNIEMKHR